MVDKTAKAQCSGLECELNIAESEYKRAQDVCDVLVHKINVCKKIIDLKTKAGG